MAVEFLALGAFADRPPGGTALRPEAVRLLARTYEDGGWDHMLVDRSPDGPEPAVTAGWVAAFTERIGVRLVHRPSDCPPAVAARTFATLDHLSAGRLTVHVTADPDDGDRTREYLRIVKGASTATRRPRPAVSFDADGELGTRVAAEADIVVLPAGPLPHVRQRMAQVTAASAAQGRTAPLRWQLDARTVVARTDAEANARAGAHGRRGGSGLSGPVISGSYETVAATLLDYAELGIEVFGLRGQDVVHDAEEVGRQVIPLVRQEVAHRECRARVTA